MPEIIVVGRGPAGISAALYCARGGVKTTVIAKDTGALERAEKIENYYGLETPPSGKQLAAAGVAQARALGVQMVDDEVVHLAFGQRLEVKTTRGRYEADSVILATGAARQSAKLPGIDKFEGSGVSYCAVCDAFFYRGKDVAVLGHGKFALHEALDLLPVASSVTILTNGQPPVENIPPEIPVLQQKVTALEGGERLERVMLADGTALPVAGLFVALGVAGSAALARKLGAETNGSSIVVDEHGATTFPGLFAAGDCTGGLLQVAKAVNDGARAGIAAVKHARGTIE